MVLNFTLLADVLIHLIDLYLQRLRSNLVLRGTHHRFLQLLLLLLLLVTPPLLPPLLKHHHHDVPNSTNTNPGYRQRKTIAIAKFIS